MQARFSAFLALIGLLALSLPVPSSANTNYLAELERQSNSALLYLYDTMPETRPLIEEAAGILIIPVVTKAAFVFGGAYGEGVLKIKNEVVDYYASIQFNFGLQAGTHQTSQILIFTDEAALEQFRQSQNFVVGARSDFVMLDQSNSHSVNSWHDRKGMIGITFAKSGLLFGSSLSGTKFSRLDKGTS